MWICYGIAVYSGPFIHGWMDRVFKDVIRWKKNVETFRKQRVDGILTSILSERSIELTRRFEVMVRTFRQTGKIREEFLDVSFINPVKPA